MSQAPLPPDEAARLQALRALGVLDTPAEEEFDALVQAAALVCGVPISLVSLVDEERQWFKAELGLPGVRETPRDLAFCAHAILQDGVFEVPDAAQDPRFADNALVTDAPSIRFYAGAPLTLGNGARVGTLCVIDRQPRQLDERQRAVLLQLSTAAARALESRRARQAEQALLAQSWHAAAVLQHSVDAIISIDNDGRVTHWNPAAERLFGHSAAEMLGQPVNRLQPPYRRHAQATARDLLGGAQAGAHYETLRLHRNGELIAVSISMAPITAPDGRTLGATKIVRDIRTQAETARELADSEARFRAFSEASPLGIFATDATGAGTYANAQWRQIHGLSETEPMDEGWHARLHPDDRLSVLAAWQRMLARPVAYDIACRVCLPDGQQRRVRTRARPIVDAEHHVTGFVGCVEDVTAQHELNERLRAGEARLRSLYESTPAMLHSIDPQGRLLAVSDRWLSVLGYQRAEALGRPSSDFLTAESRARVPAVLRDFFRDGRCVDVPYQMVARDGTVLDVRMSAVLERDENGTPLQSMAVIEDVTARLQTERALASEHQRLTAIVDGTGAGTWEWNVATGEVQYSERWAAVLGYTLADLGPPHISTRIALSHPDELPRSEALLRQHFRGETDRYEDECRLRHRQGHWVWVRDHGRATARDDQGRALVVHGMLDDISLRKQQEAALRRSLQLLRRTGAVAGVGGWELDAATGVLIWSPELRRIYGVDEDYQPVLDEAIAFYAPEAREALRAAVSLALADGTPWDLELRFHPRGGAPIWVHTVGHAEVQDGRVLRLTGAVQDVSERVAQRLAVERANERFQLATASGDIGVWDFDMVSGQLSWEARIFRMYGLPETTAHADFALWTRLVHPEDRAAGVAAVQTAMAGRAPFDIEFRIVWPDGSIRHLRSTAELTRDAAGRVIRLVGVTWDVTQLRQLSAQLADQHELLQVTLQSIGDAVITTDATGHVTWLNPVAERMTGWPSADAQGRPLDQVFHIVHQDTRAPAPNPVAACLQQDQVVGLAQHSVLLSRDGCEFGIEDSASPIRNKQGQVLGAVLVFHDVSEQRRLSGEMTYRATHDPLTGLVNRAEFESRLLRLLRRAHEDQSIHALMYLDLDQFKLVNDACGHAVGDHLLQQVSKLLGAAIRSRDTLARLGGDEFGILLEHCDPDQAQRVAQKVCDQMAEFRFVHDGRRFRIGTSIGLVPLDARWSTITAVQQAADSSCYAAKEAGRNRVHLWFDTDVAMRERQFEMQWTTRIEQALDEDRFRLFVQRIVPLRDRTQPMQAEVLLRMVADDGSLVAPGAFLPAAERFHMATRIDRWVLRHTIAHLEAMASLDTLGCLSVNLSGQSVGDRAFHRWAIEVLSATRPAICQRLCVEITETSAITNLADAALFIEAVSALGVRVALDDFGAGASSFGYLKSLKVHGLKIDGQFIRTLIDDPLSAAAVRCFVDVAQVVGVHTVAEFVERPEVMARLRELGIDFAQGYLLHRPEAIDGVLPRSGEAARQAVSV